MSTVTLPENFGKVEFDEIQLGKELGPREWTITFSEIDDHCLTQGSEFHEWYSVGYPTGGRVAPPSISYLPGRRLFSEAYPVSGLFVGWSHEQFDLLRPHRKMTLHGRVSDKYVKRERNWVWYELECKDAETGKALFRTKRGHVLDYRQGDVARQPVAEGAARPLDPYRPVAFETRSESETDRQPDAPIFAFKANGGQFPIGFELTPVSFQLTRRAVTEYIHGHRGHDELEGLPAPVASGPLAAAQIHKMMVNHFGDGYVGHARFDLRFVNMMLREDFITAKGRVVGHRLEDGAHRIECEVWVERQTGQKSVVGSASALIGR